MARHSHGERQALTLESLHKELQELRASIRQDLHEELSRAQNRAGKSASHNGLRKTDFLAPSPPDDVEVYLPAVIEEDLDEDVKENAGNTSGVEFKKFHTEKRDFVPLRCTSDPEGQAGQWHESTSDSEKRDRSFPSTRLASEYASASRPELREGFSMRSTRFASEHNSPFAAQASTRFASEHTVIPITQMNSTDSTPVHSFELDEMYGREPGLLEQSLCDALVSQRSHKDLHVQAFRSQARNSMRKWVGRQHLSMIEDEKTTEDRLTWAETFEILSALAIVVNGGLFGVQVEVMANKRTEDAPIVFLFGEILFFVIFAAELFLRLSTDRQEFWKGPSWKWNFFDALLVLVQMFDLIMEAIKKLTQRSNVNLAFLATLRILRILRVCRLVRLLKYFGEMNMAASAIASSFKTLGTTVMMLCLMVYIFAIAFTGAANSYLVQLQESGSNTDGDPVEVWWNSLGRAALSLYEAFLGGVTWDDLMLGLLEINVFWALLFLVYISFMILTMLNVITGIFVDSALKRAAQFKENALLEKLRRLFRVTDSEREGTGVISLGDFEHELRRPRFRSYMQEIGLEPREVRVLSSALSAGKSDYIVAEDFFQGLLRLRSAARIIDIMNLENDLENDLDHLPEKTARQTTRVTKHILRKTAIQSWPDRQNSWEAPLASPAMSREGTLERLGSNL